MRRFPRIVALAVPGAVALGCGGDDSGTSPAAAACGRIVDASCAKLVECHAVINGTPVTNAVCAQVRSDAVQQCLTEEGDAVGAATEAEVDACVQGFGPEPCTDICNRVPLDPPACTAISPDPNTRTIACTP